MKFVSSVVLVALLAAATAVQVSNSAVRPLKRSAPVVPAPVSPPATCACRMPENPSDGFENDSTPMMKAMAVETRKPDRHYTYTVMQVKVPFRGCPPKGKYIVVRSPKTAAACGVSLTPGTTYAVTARLMRSSTPPPGLPSNMEVYTATSCGYNKPWTSCPQKEKSFLYYQDPKCTE